MIDPTAIIHPSALVEGATIGPRTRVWQFASVIRGTVLGADCNVASCATLDGPSFGDRCTICQGVAMGPGFRFGDRCFVGPNVTVCNDMWPEPGREGFDMEALRDPDRWSVIAEDDVTIGANAVILPGVRLGKGCVVAAGAVAERDVPVWTLLRRDGRLADVTVERRDLRMRWAS
jgi:UDP-3-O-[3-hydroxymyristoyl] glucosamine N-acyltransferase